MISQVRRILLALKPVSSVVKVSEGSSVLANVTYAESMVIMSCPIRDRHRYLRGTAYTPIRYLRLNYLRFERKYGATCGVSLIVKASWLTSSDHCIPVVGLFPRNNRNVGSSYTTLPCFRLGGQALDLQKINSKGVLFLRTSGLALLVIDYPGWSGDVVNNKFWLSPHIH